LSTTRVGRRAKRADAISQNNSRRESIFAHANGKLYRNVDDPRGESPRSDSLVLIDSGGRRGVYGAVCAKNFWRGHFCITNGIGAKFCACCVQIFERAAMPARVAMV
jgi:hypothetical protein